MSRGLLRFIRQSSRRRLWVTLGLLGAAAAGILVAWSIRVTPTTIPLTDLHWERPPSLVAVEGVRREDKDGLLFLRLKDGKEQFVIGKWRSEFSESGVYVIREEEPISDRQAGVPMYYIVGGEFAQEFRISNLPGRIASVEENPPATYVFLRVETDTSTLFCVANRLADAPQCQQLQVSDISRGHWNPKKERELVIQTSKDELFTFDPWEKKPHEVNPDTDPVRLKELRALFISKEYPPREITVPDQGTSSFWQAISLLVVRTPKKWVFRRVPVSARLSWIGDTDHVLIVEQDSVSVLELSSNRRAVLLQEKGVGKKPIHFRTLGRNVAL